MINYIEKGSGLHRAIEESGEWLHQVDNVWVASNEAAVQALIDGYTLDQAKQACCAEVIALATAKFNRAIESYSKGELARWPALQSEADAYSADPAASVPRLTSEAQYRGVTVEALVAKVKANATKFNSLGDQIAGISGKHRDAIMALGDFAAVLSYDYSTGWPAV